ncbi:hypothetical protein [Actinomadura craniellae]|uniref:hypothetical protein n=1 Tax=Actinomadura craniellae TaxID=2231787 RepID=UPI001314AB2F|nr:hypothetical protein [Actinomadura craniellae]
MIRRLVLACAVAAALTGCGAAPGADAPAGPSEHEIAQLEKIVDDAERAATEGEQAP